MLAIRNIVFVRIDERLLHGQVVTAWVANSGCNVIYIIDDELERNTMLVGLYSKLAPRGTSCHVLSIAKAVESLLTEPSDVKEKIMLLVKTPQVLENLVMAGIQLKSINLGNMASNKERKLFVESVYASPEEIASMGKMVEQGISIVYQVSPYSRAVDVKAILEKKK